MAPPQSMHKRAASQLLRLPQSRALHHLLLDWIPTHKGTASWPWFPDLLLSSGLSGTFSMAGPSPPGHVLPSTAPFPPVCKGLGFTCFHPDRLPASPTWLCLIITPSPSLFLSLPSFSSVCSWPENNSSTWLDGGIHRIPKAHSRHLINSYQNTEWIKQRMNGINELHSVNLSLSRQKLHFIELKYMYSYILI